MSKRPRRDVIAMMVAAIRKEATHPDYRVADHATVDWCPCCGVNLRLHDEDGNMFAKLVLASPEEARRLGGALVFMSCEMERMMRDDKARERMQRDFERAAMQPSPRANV